MKIFDRKFVAGCRRGTSILLIMAISACLTTACGRAAAPQTSEADQKLPAKFLAYIRDSSATMLVLDTVEGVEIPSDRASELGLDEDDAPSGFYVHNPDVEEEKLTLSADCDILIFDWKDNYVQKNVSAEEFADELSGRGEMNDAIPYHITVKDGAIIEIEEQYMP